MRPVGPGSGSKCRRGSIAVFVLVCLVAITMICGVLLRIGLAERQRLRSEERRLQAEWLVESGLERAAARIERSQGAYRGETWELAPAELGGRDSGRVTIAVLTAEDAPGQRRVRVQADYPQNETTRVRLRKEWTVAIEAAPREGAP